LHAAFANVWRWLGIAALVGAAVFLAYKVVQFDSTGWLALDFKFGAAQRLVDGQTLYPADASGEYPYPPLWAFLVSPFLLLPNAVAPYVACLLCAAAIVGALWIVGLRDPLCYAAALVSGPVVSGTQIGNTSAVVALLLALGYRFNGAPLGVAVALKLYTWPLILWSALRRGIRDLALAVAVGVAAVFVPWAAIGFDGIDRYVRVTRTIMSDLPTFALPTSVSIVVTALALAAMYLRRDDPVGSFSFAVLAMISSTPVLWEFYFAAVLLPLALRRPRFSIVWLLPFLLTAVHGNAHTLAFMGLLVWCGLGAPGLRIPMRRQLRPDT
jgi:hypothetical protein